MWSSNGLKVTFYISSAINPLLLCIFETKHFSLLPEFCWLPANIFRGSTKTKVNEHAVTTGTCTNME